MKKNVLLVTLDFPPSVGGVANYQKNILQGFSAKHTFVLANEHPHSHRFDPTVPYTIIRKPFFSQWFFPRWIALFFYVWKAVKRFDIDYILVGEVLPTGIVVRIISQICRVPYLVFTHGLDIRSADLRPRKKFLALKIFQRASALVSNSKFTAALLEEKGIDSKKITVITPGVDAYRFEVDCGEVFTDDVDTVGKKILFSVGRLVERKGFDMALKAVARLKDTVPNILYVLAGDGPDKKRLKKMIRDLGIQDYVYMTGRINDEELGFWYRMSDVFVTTSRVLENGDVEGFGIIYLEANYFGIPVVAGRSGGVEEAVIHEKTGILVDPTSISEITSSISELLLDDDKRHKLGEQGKERVHIHFGWQNRSTKLKSIIEHTEL